MRRPRPSAPRLACGALVSMCVASWVGCSEGPPRSAGAPHPGAAATAAAPPAAAAADDAPPLDPPAWPELRPATVDAQPPSGAESATPPPPRRMRTGAPRTGATASNVGAPRQAPTLDDVLAGLPTGAIAFNTPEEIALGESAVVALLLSPGESEADLAAGLVGSGGPVETARVRFAVQMEAALTGLGFRVEPITPLVQGVSLAERTEWRWQVRAESPDVQPLHLTLSAHVRLDGERVTRAIKTFERTIAVRVPLARRLAGVANDHAELVVTVLLAPLAAAGWRYVRRRRRRAAAQRTAAPPEATSRAA